MVRLHRAIRRRRCIIWVVRVKRIAKVRVVRSSVIVIVRNIASVKEKMIFGAGSPPIVILLLKIVVTMLSPIWCGIAHRLPFANVYNWKVLGAMTLVRVAVSGGLAMTGTFVRSTIVNKA